jgi:hypothetical protein
MPPSSNPPTPAQMYYFYRYMEAPLDAKKRPAADKDFMGGGVLTMAAAAGRAAKVAEEGSERQLMFSNHGTWMDEAGVINAESFLFTTKARGGEEGRSAGRLPPPAAS